METRYDILVVGSGISGLISAVLLASKGYRVAIVSGVEGAGSYEKEGYRFNERPVLITGLSGGPLGKVFDVTGIPKEIGIRKNISYQVVLPDERVDVYEEPALFYEELRRCFPGEIDKVSEFYRCISLQSEEIRPLMDQNPFSFRLLLPSAARKGKISVTSLIEGLGLSREFYSFIMAQLSSFSYLCGPPTVTAASSVLESFRKGLYLPGGGAERIKKLLLERFKALKGDVIGSPAREISRNGNRWLLRTEGEAISGRTVIGNIDVLAFCGLFLDGSRGYLKKADRIEKALYPLSINLGVKEKGIPVGMAENVIMLREYREEPVPGDLLFVQMTPSGDGRISMNFTCHVPKEDCGKDGMREISEKVLEGVDRLCPFIERHTDVVDIRNPDPNGYGRYVTSLKQKMGVGVLPYKIYDGVFFAGPEVFPSLGFDGLVYSGEMAASAALKALTAKA